MASLSFGDILTKLRFLLIVVLSLFALMHVGAALALFVDVSAKRETIKCLCSAAVGFEETPDGVWTWRLQHASMEKLVDAPRGSLPSLAAVLAFPFVRLRVALPSELVPGSVAQACGLRSGLSAAGLSTAADDINSVMDTMARGFSSVWSSSGGGGGKDKVSSKRIPEVVIGASGEPVPQAAMRIRFARLKANPLAERASLSSQHSRFADACAGMVGTAIVLAHIANQRALSVVELGARRAAASKLFHGVRVDGIDHNFDSLMSCFMLMLGCDAGGLCISKSWLLSARLWRLVLLQHADGSWDGKPRKIRGNWV